MILSGKPIAQQMKADQQRRILAAGITPKLAIIQAGNELASTTYINMKQQYARDIGAIVDHHHSSGDLSELKEMMQQLNTDESVHGIIIQLPLPNPEITDQATALIAPAKDVDGLSPHGDYQSATAVAVLKLLEGYNIELEDKAIVVVGSGRLVGQPLAKILRSRNLNVTQGNKDTANLAAIIAQADIVVSATGAGHIIKPGMVKSSAVVVDVGAGEDRHVLVSDVDPALLKDESLSVSPATGGVGPLTVGTLFEHVLAAARIPQS